MFAKIVTTLSFASAAIGTGISITPHDKYSSSIGVLGCKVDTNRIAYWPLQPSCDSMCVKVSANGRTVHLLQVDTSGGAYDISYDAWNYLLVGKNATESPQSGGGFDAEYESVPMDDCKDILTAPDGKLPLMAANSINFYTSCKAGSWVAENTSLWNIQNAACTLGFNEKCDLDLAASTQPSCAHMLGSQNPLSGLNVINIDYGTGALSDAV